MLQSQTLSCGGSAYRPREHLTSIRGQYMQFQPLGHSDPCDHRNPAAVGAGPVGLVLQSWRCIYPPPHFCPQQRLNPTVPRHSRGSLDLAPPIPLTLLPQQQSLELQETPEMAEGPPILVPQAVMPMTQSDSTPMTPHKQGQRWHQATLQNDEGWRQLPNITRNGTGRRNQQLVLYCHLLDIKGSAFNSKLLNRIKRGGWGIYPRVFVTSVPLVELLIKHYEESLQHRKYRNKTTVLETKVSLTEFKITILNKLSELQGNKRQFNEL